MDNRETRHENLPFTAPFHLLNPQSVSRQQAQPHFVRPRCSSDCQQQVAVGSYQQPRLPLYVPQQIVQPTQLIQTAQIAQTSLRRKRGRPKKQRPEEFQEPQEQVLTQRPYFNTRAPATLTTSSTGPQQFYPTGIHNTPSYSQYSSNYNPLLHNQLPFAQSILPPYSTSATNFIAAQRNQSAQRARSETQTSANTGGNANASTQNLHQIYNFTPNTATEYIGNQYYCRNYQYYNQPNQESHPVASGFSVSSTALAPLHQIEAVVQNLDAHIKNIHQNQISSSNTGTRNTYVAQPHVHSTSHTSASNVYQNQNFVYNTAAETIGRYVPPSTSQNIEPQTTSLSAYSAPGLAVPNVPIVQNRAEHVLTNANISNTSQDRIVNFNTTTLNNSYTSQFTHNIEPNVQSNSPVSDVPPKQRKRSKFIPADINKPKKRFKTATKTSSSDTNVSKSGNTSNQVHRLSDSATGNRNTYIPQADTCNTQPHVQSSSFVTHNVPTSNVLIAPNERIGTPANDSSNNTNVQKPNTKPTLLSINNTSATDIVNETVRCIEAEEDLVNDTASEVVQDWWNEYDVACTDDEDYNDLVEILMRDRHGKEIYSDSHEVNTSTISTTANNTNSVPSNSSTNLALITENNDVQLLQYPRNASNFGSCTALISQHTRTPPAESSGVAINTEQFFSSCSARERRPSGASQAAGQPPSSSTIANFNATLPTVGFVQRPSHHPNSFVPGGTNYGNAGGDNNDGFSAEQYLLKQTHLPERSVDQEPFSQQPSPVLENIEVNFAEDILEVGAASEQLTSPYNIITSNSVVSQEEQQHVPTSDMKYETQSGPPPAQPHMTSAGVEPPHSSQGPGMTMGSSPTDAEGVMLPSWNGGAPDYLDQSSIKQSSQSLSDTWDSLLIDQTITLDVPQPQIAADRRPLPSFIGYTSHLSINGISGLHYHTIASSTQRVLQSGSPTQSSTTEYYGSVVPDTHEYQESPVVSSSTPCQQGGPKQQQPQHTNNQHCNQHHHHNHHQQQLPQSTQQIELDIEADIARLISNAIAADTTVSSGGSSANDANSGNDGTTGNGSNGGSSSLVQDQDTTSRHTSPWNDIVDWFDTACTTNKHQENNVYTVYSTSSPVQTQQHSSNIPNLLTYSPLLQARLQAGNTETPSSTSTYPPVSPPGRVSTSGSPDQNLHSSYTAPSHSRKRSRGSQGTQNPAKKAAAAISYSNDASMAGGKEKPVHRCSICSRGFLNKSNIKVHLRTHTGEKPFKCTTCEKTFRQKAHLIKHQQIHKRGSRD